MGVWLDLFVQFRLGGSIWRADALVVGLNSKPGQREVADVDRGAHGRSMKEGGARPPWLVRSPALQRAVLRGGWAGLAAWEAASAGRTTRVIQLPT